MHPTLFRDATEPERPGDGAPSIRSRRGRAARTATAERVVVVGGGAGGLELAVRLARRARRRDGLTVTLVDAAPTHLWKPLLHELATGSLNGHRDETSYAMLGARHGFEFVLGRVTGIDAGARELRLDALRDRAGETLVPERALGWTKLVLAVGSESADFGVEGVAWHAHHLDSRAAADRLHEDFVSAVQRTHAADVDGTLSIVIVGGGATGVELAADLHGVLDRLRARHVPTLPPKRLRVSVVEASDRLLAPLPERVGEAARDELERLGVRVATGSRVTRVFAGNVTLAGGERLRSNLTVWAAGIRAPGLLAASGLPVDGLGRVRVDAALRVEGVDDAFAIGDCAACTDARGAAVPPRAQSAHQMAKAAARNVLAACAGREPAPFVYRDVGSLVNLSRYRTVGSVVGAVSGRDRFVAGRLARVAYLSLYRMHQAAVHGPVGAVLLALGDRLHRVTHASVKLH